MKNVLVTGAGGFVGGHVAEGLVAAGYKVTAMLGHGDTFCPAGARIIKGEIRDRSAIEDAMSGIDLVIHAAGPASVAESFSNPHLYISVHVDGTTTLVSAAAAAGIDRVILISSAEVYGSPVTARVTERSRCCPISPYGAAKLSAELVARTIPAPSGSLAIVRPFSLYGPRMRQTSVVGVICDAVSRGEPVQLATLSPVRDYLHISDFVELLLLLLVTADFPQIVNACSGRGISVGRLAEAAMLIVGRSDTPREREGVTRPTDVGTLIGSSVGGRALGWRPRTSLVAGLQTMLSR